MNLKLKPALAGILIINICLLIFVLYTVLKNRCSKSVHKQPDSRIVGGFPANIRHHRYMAALVITKAAGLPEDTLQCGCSIISLRWVLTAAHCVLLVKVYHKHTIQVSAGSSHWIKGHRHDIDSWVSHPKYDNHTMTHDIGMIKAKQPFNRKNEGRVPIASPRYVYKANRKVRVLGWGITHSSSTQSQPHLSAVDVFTIAQSDCRRMYSDKLVSDTMFCAGTKKGGKDACQFDSGGPIIEKGLLIGIVSWGVDCGVKDQPGVYTRINSYRKWLITTSKKHKSPLMFKDVSKS